jgi:hypothetical protein
VVVATFWAEAEMIEYRAYTVGTDDHFIGFQEMICRDDDEAVAKATRLVNGHDIEVWNGPRLVIRLARSKPANP